MNPSREKEVKRKRTTINIENSTKDSLLNLKLYPRETYDEIIKRIINKTRPKN